MTRHGPISYRVVALDGSSANSSVRTSNPVLVADWRQLTASLQTGGPGSHTLQATNYSGSTVPLAEGNWSTISTIAAQGVSSIDPGMRYLRWIRPATDSQGTVIFVGRS
jgi:hypothetical protein